MTYRSLHKTKERYEVAVMVLLIVAFVLAWAMMFVHPSVALLIFFAGLLIAGASVVGVSMVSRAQHAAARVSLRSHRCPSCGTEVHEIPTRADAWHCDECGAEFQADGTELL